MQTLRSHLFPESFRTISRTRGLTLLVALGAATTSAQAPVPKIPVVLTEAEESALALEALPAELRAEAGLWLLTPTGFREKRRARNAYTCIVNRDEVEAIKPTCYDQEGTRTILPTVVRFGELLMKGVPVQKIREDIAEGFRTKRFTSPERAGIAFMLSARVVNVINAARRQFGTAPPHYMIYAPHLTNADLGLTDAAYDASPWLPYVAYTGPHGFLIITVPEPVSAPVR